MSKGSPAPPISLGVVGYEYEEGTAKEEGRPKHREVLFCSRPPQGPPQYEKVDYYEEGRYFRQIGDSLIWPVALLGNSEEPDEAL